MQAALEFGGTLLLGAVAGVTLDQLVSPLIAHHRERRALRRARARRYAFDYAGRPFEFDGVDLGVQVLVGSIGETFGRDDLHATLDPEPWVAPAHLRGPASEYAARRGYYDGAVARLERLDVATHLDEHGRERHRLQLEIRPTGYFDMLATNVALGPFTPQEAPLLNGRHGLPETPLSNMLGLDLTLVTSDGYVPVFLRAPGMAGLERCWQTSSGETVQLPVDQDTDQRPDVFLTAVRGLDEELGLSSDQLDDLAVTAFVATPEYANVGVLMRGVLSCTGAEFENRFNNLVLSARDNWEYTAHSMVAIDDVRDLARAFTDPTRAWTKQSVASIVLAHAERAGGLGPLARAIRNAGSLNLHGGPASRDVPAQE